MSHIEDAFDWLEFIDTIREQQRAKLQAATHKGDKRKAAVYAKRIAWLERCRETELKRRSVRDGT